MTTVIRSLLVGAAFALIVAACGGSALVPGGPNTPPPTTCGGSHEWPPNGYPPAPASLVVEIVSGTTVRVRNETDEAWVARVAAWADLTCVGYMSTAEDPRRELAPHTAFEATIADPGWGGQLRIGVELWDHPCDEACTDSPTGFAFVDPAPTSLPTASEGASASSAPVPFANLSVGVTAVPAAHVRCREQ